MNAYSPLAAVAALVLALHPGISASAQAIGVERTFPQSQADVEKALAEIRPTAKGRLPALEGFVGTTEQPLERYKSGYYECAIKVSPATSGGTVVRVAAKVTAWFTDTNPARSGYRTLPSNGRIESDFLDRLGEILEPAGDKGPAAPPAGAITLPPPQSFPSGPARSSPLPALGNAARATEPTAPGQPASESAAKEGERVQAEQHAEELRKLAQNLEEILRNQARPENLAAVLKSGTPVYSRPQASAQVLFAAEAQDEFQILEVQPAWVHVQISGASRGWIRRAQLEMPSAFAGAPAKAAESTPEGAVSFRVTRETVSKFPGEWPPLSGKTVKVFDVEPAAGMATSAKEKRTFARSLLAAHYPEISALTNPVAGVVVVFDSADGGQISATLVDLRELQEGRISEQAFWQRCRLEPPSAFEDSAKP